MGIQTFVGHAADNLATVDAVVTSTAVKADNPEVLAAARENTSLWCCVR
jgi:UDP-N-acetylmuramate--alanine ligase